MRIKTVKLRNFKRFTKSLTLTGIPDNVRLVVLLGPNGYGKSSVFDAFLVKSRAQRNNSPLQGQFADYYETASSLDTSTGNTAQIAQRIDIDFHGEQPTNDQWSRVFYIRTAYRNEADFQLDTVGRLAPSTETPRFARIIDPDQSVSDNYKRFIWKRLADLDKDAPGSMTFENYRRESLEGLQNAMKQLFDDPSLSLQDFGGIQTAGAFRFAKGITTDFHYKNLSGGEKAAFDLLLDLFVKRVEYPDAIYCIDEPETHTATAIHGQLLEVMLDMVPQASQLWIATHSIGFVRKAYDLMRERGDVVFLDFSEKDLDQEVTISPKSPDRGFWQRAYKVTLDDLGGLITPKHIVICEGSNTDGTRGFDAACYNEIFAETHADTLFVSYGGANEVSGSQPLVAVLQAVAQGATISRVIDRDDMTENARNQKIADDIRVLRRRELENYLWDPEVIKNFLTHKACDAGTIGEVLAKQEELLAGGPVATADIKKITRELFERIKSSSGIANLGNRREEFAQQFLVPALKRTPSVYQKLKDDIFS